MSRLKICGGCGFLLCATRICNVDWCGNDYRDQAAFEALEWEDENKEESLERELQIAHRERNHLKEVLEQCRDVLTLMHRASLENGNTKESANIRNTSYVSYRAAKDRANEVLSQSRPRPDFLWMYHNDQEFHTGVKRLVAESLKPYVVAIATKDECLSRLREELDLYQVVEYDNGHESVGAIIAQALEAQP